MAKELEAPQPKGGIPLIAVLLLTLIGGGAGGFFGMQIPGLVKPDEAPGQAQGAHDPHAKPEAEPKKIEVRALAPITTNLASPANTWIRLELAAILTQELGVGDGPLIDQIAEDVVAFVRTLPLEQIEGPSGFQHLREDLNDRVRIRSHGKVTELLVQAFVVE
jgi:flagellar protein FliL